MRIWSHSASAEPPISAWSAATTTPRPRSEEHTSELQSLRHLVCRLLLEKKKQEKYTRRAPGWREPPQRPHRLTPSPDHPSCTTPSTIRPRAPPTDRRDPAARAPEHRERQ